MKTKNCNHCHKNIDIKKFRVNRNCCRHCEYVKRRDGLIKYNPKSNECKECGGMRNGNPRHGRRCYECYKKYLLFRYYTINKQKRKDKSNIRKKEKQKAKEVEEQKIIIERNNKPFKDKIEIIVHC
jgi:hypothetical protein